jgi:tRNA (guanine37-N1)-methyltransferase
MRFTFVTIFPEIVEGYFSASILKRAVENSLIELDFVNPRDYTLSRYKKVDESMIGGGAGMLMSPQPLDDALKSIKRDSPNAHVIFLTPAGKPFRQHDAKRLSSMRHIVLVAGRYEGIDERILELHADELFSTGDFILTGGELPALCICDAVSRNIEGVLGNSSSLLEESFEENLLEAPSFSKPDLFMGKRVVSEYLKGNHSKIAAIKKQMALSRTKYFRPDLYRKAKVEK